MKPKVAILCQCLLVQARSQPFATLSTHLFTSPIALDLINPAKTAEIPIEHSARLTESAALAITRSDPGDNLDLTRNTPIWSLVSWADPAQGDQIVIEGGEGLGRHAEGPAIYAYARQLIQTNLSGELSADQKN